MTSAVLIGAVGVGVAWDRLHIQPAALNAAEPGEKSKPLAENDTERTADRDALAAALKHFVTTFNKGDAKALADLWTEEGEYVSDDGATRQGRTALEDGYAQFFKKNPDVWLDMNVDSVHFVSHDSAAGEGSARTHKGAKTGEPISSRVSALYARENGHWLLAALRKWPDNGATLSDVDWLIGSWETKNENVDVRTTYVWDGGKTFLFAGFTMMDKGKDEAVTGTQIIGKNPRTGQLQSWLFESDGGFGVGSRTTANVIRPGGRQNTVGLRSGSFTTNRGTTIDYPRAGRKTTGPGGVTAGRGVGGVKVTAPNCQQVT